ncbi:hypothetical protein yberc0001_33550 [Yersinia bercovieri ATCC 43970]|uniref:Uncharacterized protein n=1 Tax=Yersinia bercovieri ATCC 43970 TaxID=349968 RepID=A0ABM9XYG2_YERBE|nr:hypothetical protein yberc0001_33550 [Yersinia bercovieri ATCC 43970]
MKSISYLLLIGYLDLLCWFYAILVINPDIKPFSLRELSAINTLKSQGNKLKK